MLTGGMPPGVGAKCSAEDAYRRLFRRVITQVLLWPCYALFGANCCSCGSALDAV